VRLLFLSHRLPYAPNRGDRIRAYHLLRALAARHEVHVIALTHDAEEASHLPELRQWVASAHGAAVNRPLRLAAALLALPSQRPLTHVLLESGRMRTAIRETVARVRPDAVLAYCSGVAKYALEPPLDAVPFVLDMVDVDSEKWGELSHSARGPLRFVYARERGRLRAFERYAAARAAATSVISERERSLLDGIAPAARTLVVANGVDVDHFAPPRPPAASREVVFCGVFNYEPNEAGAVWLAREIWPLVRAEEPEARLTLVGMHPTRTVQALSADPTIRVTGAVPDVRPYLWDAAAAAAPLLIARGLQNKVLEAIAAGLPCVVTPAVLGGLPAETRQACLAAATPTAFAGAILSLLRQGPGERRQRASLGHIESLRWDSQLAPLVTILEDMSRIGTKEPHPPRS
jgi:sugar transferase (PEP-CTERM/EpsH1 system associated)